ncbi:MAG: YdeI/OmpD-associated family protein [Saprospiraceae bacterium]
MKIRKFELVTTLLKFDQKGEKTGWTYILIKSELSNQLNPNIKKSYRINCTIDSLKDLEFSILPIGDGDFIIPIKKDLQVKLKKKVGDKVNIIISLNSNENQMDKDFIEFLETEPKAKEFFKSLVGSHQRYFSKWIESAKTPITKANRIAKVVEALSKRRGFNEINNI